MEKMDNYNQIKHLLSTMSGMGNIIAIPRLYIELFDDIPMAMLLNQIVYWSDKTTREDGYFYKTYKEWEEELGLSKKQSERAVGKLRKLGLIETKLEKANGVPTLHYKANVQKLAQMIVSLKVI